MDVPIANPSPRCPLFEDLEGSFWGSFGGTFGALLVTLFRHFWRHFWGTFGGTFQALLETLWGRFFRCFQNDFLRASILVAYIISHHWTVCLSDRYQNPQYKLIHSFNRYFRHAFSQSLSLFIFCVSNPVLHKGFANLGSYGAGSETFVQKNLFHFSYL